MRRLLAALGWTALATGFLALWLGAWLTLVWVASHDTAPIQLLLR
jgi:hypothetical protein